MRTGFPHPDKCLVGKIYMTLLFENGRVDERTIGQKVDQFNGACGDPRDREPRGYR